MKILCPNYVKTILDTFHQAGFQAYIVGGCVRDSLLNKVPHDYDVTTNAKPEQVQALFERTIPTGIDHGTITVMSECPVEVTTFRQESMYSDHRHPDHVAFVNDLIEDLARRDFTINAMAYDPILGLVDPFGGQTDLEKHIIRAVGNPYERFHEDALRMLRAHRFAARFHFQIETQTKKAIQQLHKDIQYVSVERVRHEILEILAANPYEIENMTLLLSHWMPELQSCRTCLQQTPYHDTNVLHHILRAIKLLDPFDETLAWTLLFHDLGKPACHTNKNGIDHFKGHPAISAEIACRICKDLKMTNAQQKIIPALVYYHDEKMKDPLAFIRKFRIQKHWSDAWIRQLFIVKHCDIMAHSAYGQQTIKQLEALEIGYETCNRPMDLAHLAIHGKDILENTPLSGKQIADALQACLEYAFDHPEKNHKEDLLLYIESRPAWK
ncbi:MAG: HD domain-containing protein [Absicoccus sp.]|uniref:CCA tRNA nucleotidyltransferase n=1 Tax=Absicoccus sp. TaxID=2718527 RepID=UPI002A7515E1|nr:HD domain-containing protein [Absicoccus sp.]MDY3036426.1 HD domain-containing protein [Absicoccus sp.]